MASLDENIGVGISGEMASQEDEISKQGGVGVSMEDFTTGSDKAVVEEFGNKKSDDLDGISFKKNSDKEKEIVDEQDSVLQSSTSETLDKIVDDINLLDNQLDNRVTSFVERQLGNEIIWGYLGYIFKKDQE